LRQQEEKNGEPLDFESFTLSFFDRFRQWLLHEAKANSNSTKKKGMLNDSVAKYLSALKTFLNWSLERDYH
jgi:site-specific recombinase XerC